MYALQGKNNGENNAGAIEKSYRQKLLLDFGWKFMLGDASSPDSDFGYGKITSFAKAGEVCPGADPDFNDSSWRTLNLPHDWAVELDFVNLKDDPLKNHGFKPIGRQFSKTTIGWYRRTFTVPKSDSGKRILIHFDGVMRDSHTWINANYLGNNLSGYTEFTYDITDYVNYGGKNVLALRVDASNYEGWFYEGAGIYRHTWLITTAPLHIPEYGTFVMSKVDKNSAKINIETQILNQENDKTSCSLVSIVQDQNGKTVGQTVPQPIKLNSFENTTARQTISINNPTLWSLENPYRYTLVSLIQKGKDVIDKVETPFGIRTVVFDKDKGFSLNGKRVEIKGTCNHQDHAGVGAALLDGIQYYRIKRLKEMGCNAYRTSHNPPTPELLDACDKLGMLVMDENRLMGSAPELAEQFKKLILRDRNHPSVIIWSLGNEEWGIQDGPVGKNIASALKRIQKELDPSRLCTFAGNNGNGYFGINEVVDVRGFNYLHLGDPDKYHKDHPGQPVWGSEEASTLCTRGIYSKDTVNGFMPDYDVSAPGWGLIAETWWKYYAARPWLAGAFVWTGFDYRGEPTPYSWPCISSHFGILDVCGFPKNNYYYYQSWWTDNDVLHLCPHWNWKGKEGQPINVWCQSNCDSVELMLNGKSCGIKKMEVNSHLEWNVPYEAGTLEAKGWRNGKILTAKTETTGEPKSIQLTPDRTGMYANAEDVCVVNVAVLDSQGREVPTADNLIQFEIKGEGKIIGVGNGNPSCHEPDKYLSGNYQRKLFNGKCQVILQSTRQSGQITLVATSDGLSPQTMNIQAQFGNVRAYVGEYH
ncbi:MAG: beta-galactosidase GalA [Bacteroidota bacterium]